jgi:hypothetical protein
MEEMRDLLQAAEAVIQAGLALHTSAEAVETREGFVQFVGALRQYLEDFLPGADTLRLDDYLAGISTVTAQMDGYDSQIRDTPTWSLFASIIAAA